MSAHEVDAEVVELATQIAGQALLEGLEKHLRAYREELQVSDGDLRDWAYGLLEGHEADVSHVPVELVAHLLDSATIVVEVTW